MRDITYKAVRAFMDKEQFYLANTEVRTTSEGGAILELHGNAIAKIDKDNNVQVRSAGWETNTTKERLNGIPNVNVQQKAGQWYLNGVKWEQSEDWTIVAICPVCDKPFINSTCASCDELVASL